MEVARLKRLSRRLSSQPRSPESYAVGEVVPAEEAAILIGKIRAGDPRSKNKGLHPDSEDVGDLVRVDLPISVFRPDYLEFIEESTTPSRVENYAVENNKTPIYALNTPKRGVYNRGGWIVSDGGHRLLAAIKRGDKVIPAFVPVKDGGI